MAIFFASSRTTFRPGCGRGADPWTTTPLMAPVVGLPAPAAVAGSTRTTSPVASVASPTPLTTRTPTTAGPLTSAIGSTAVNAPPAAAGGSATYTRPRT